MIDAVGRGFAWAGLNRTAQAKGKQPTRLRPEWLTKQRPAKALDVNEAEVREGDVVWVARTGAGPYTVEKVWDCQPAPDRGQLRNPFTAKWVVKVEGSPDGVFYLAKDLTHERPDSWERIEEDARLKPSEYAGKYRIGRIGFEAEDVRVDLVRRAKKLAGEA